MCVDAEKVMKKSLLLPDTRSEKTQICIGNAKIKKPFCEDKECHNTFLIGLPLSKFVRFLMPTVFKYNQQWSTIDEHFGGRVECYILMTQKFFVVFVNMKFNFVST